MSNKEIKRYRSYGPGFVVSEELPNHLIGRILTLLDIAGLKDTQEKPLKDFIRQEVWNLFNPDGYRDTIWIPGQLHNEIQYAIEDIKEEIKTLPGGIKATNTDTGTKYSRLTWLDDYEYEVLFKLKKKD